MHLVSLHQIIIGEVRGWRKIATFGATPLYLYRLLEPHTLLGFKNKKSMIQRKTSEIMMVLLKFSFPHGYKIH